MTSTRGAGVLYRTKSEIPHYSVTRQELDEVPPFEDIDEWHEIVWGEVEQRGYVFLRASDKFSRGAMHLPIGFPHDGCEYEANESIACGDGEQPVLCRECDVEEFRAKPARMIPPGYYDVCSYCMYIFLDWWLSTNGYGGLE